jgi:hypothetical protein
MSDNDSSAADRGSGLSAGLGAVLTYTCQGRSGIYERWAPTERASGACCSWARQSMPRTLLPSTCGDLNAAAIASPLTA